MTDLPQPNPTTALVCFGTRPEAIKMAPIVHQLERHQSFTVRVCVTAQHREMLDQVLGLFGISPNHDLNLMSPNQTLAQLTADIVSRMSEVLESEKPDLVIVQGDTTTTFAVALAAFYHRIPVAHIEAGLRTYNRYSPFPEEVNRRLTSGLTHWHFPPTERAKQALLGEGFAEDSIYVVGNTVIDALLSILDRAREYGLSTHPDLLARLATRKSVLITGHRRENFGEGFRAICRAIRRLAEAHPAIDFVYPVHLNPNVGEPVRSLLEGVENVQLIAPLDYLDFVRLMDACSLVLTDSGGVQEEAPSLGKPVLVMRDTTERPEAVEAGVARLVGTEEDAIVHHASVLLTDDAAHAAMSCVQNPYGDGSSALQIVNVLANL